MAKPSKSVRNKSSKVHLERKEIGSERALYDG
jgi:hypothetical protein